MLGGFGGFVVLRRLSTVLRRADTAGPSGGRGRTGLGREVRDRRRDRSRAIALALLAAEYDRYP